MSDQPQDASEAANLFVRMFITVALRRAINVVTADLEKGPAGRKPPQDKLLLHDWFQKLDETDRANVVAVIREAAEAAVFGSLVFLDGLSGSYPVKGQPSDFAVYLQVYPDDDALGVGSAQSSVRLNPVERDYEDLHDILHAMLAGDVNYPLLDPPGVPERSE